MMMDMLLEIVMKGKHVTICTILPACGFQFNYFIFKGIYFQRKRNYIPFEKTCYTVISDFPYMHGLLAVAIL